MLDELKIMIEDEIDGVTKDSHAFNTMSKEEREDREGYCLLGMIAGRSQAFRIVADFISEIEKYKKYLNKQEG